MSTENKKSSGFITLQQIVHEVLNDIGQYTLQDYKRLMQFVIRGYTDLKLFDVKSFEVAYLTMSEVGTIELPSDFIEYTKIGIQDSKGNIHILGLNDNMGLARDISCGEDINTYFDTEGDDLNMLSENGYYFAPHYRGTNYYAALYGLGGGYTDSYYRIDPERGVIQFTSSVPSGIIVLEYISSGISMTGSTYVPRQYRETLIAWTHWKRKQHDPLFTRAEKMDAKQDYLEEEQKLRDFEIPTIQEIQDIFYESYKQTPKR